MCCLFFRPILDIKNLKWIIAGWQLSKIYFTVLKGRKKSPLDPSCCPVCGITLRTSDLESHFVQEIERLERVSRSYRSTANHSSVSPSSSSMSAPSTTQAQKREQDTRWEVKSRCDGYPSFWIITKFFIHQTFHRIRINRTNRVRAKARKRRADEREDLPMDSGAAGCSSNTPCPICGEKMYGTAEELNMHVVQCLRRVSWFLQH